MVGWRIKFLLVLIVYLGGFATGIYFLAPVAEGERVAVGEQGWGDSVFRSDEFARSLSVKMHNAVDECKAAAKRAGEFIKEQVNEGGTQI